MCRKSEGVLSLMLLERVKRGERFLITKHGNPVAQLVPVSPEKELSPREAVRKLGPLSGRFVIPSEQAGNLVI